jgi:hypothetical protein
MKKQDGHVRSAGSGACSGMDARTELRRGTDVGEGGIWGAMKISVRSRVATGEDLR